jgi:hypothetical protein
VRDDRHEFAAEPLPSDLGPGTGEESGRSTIVARFHNVAEAGYFVEALAANDIAATLRAEEQFDGISGTWSCRYALSVDENDAHLAAQRLRDLVDGEAIAPPPERHDETGRRDDFADEPAAGPSLLPWALLLLVLVVAAIVWGQVGKARRIGAAGVREAVPPDPAPPEPWREMTSRPGRWIQFDGEGRPVRQIVVHADGRATLTADTNGDGRPDSRVEFDAPAVP